MLKLSDQEIAIIKYLCDGLTAKQIASQIYLSVHCVHYHKKQIFKKLDAKSSTEVVSIAKSKNII